jgi:hypothetical protein
MKKPSLHQKMTEIIMNAFKAAAAAEAEAEAEARTKGLPIIVVCGNDETICHGYVGDANQHMQGDAALAFVIAACRVIDNSGLAIPTIDSNFTAWNGGKHYKCGGKVGGEKWGFGAGLVVCHDRHVPVEIEELCWEAAGAGRKARDTELENA